VLIERVITRLPVPRFLGGSPMMNAEPVVELLMAVRCSSRRSRQRSGSAQCWPSAR